jgi:hypothetical protein
MLRMAYPLLCLLMSVLAATSASAKESTEGTPSESTTSDEKPLILMVFDQNCKAWCAKVRPVIAELKQEFSDQSAFAELDVTQNVLKEAKDQAKHLGLGSFVADIQDYVPVVAIFTSKDKSTRHLVKEEVGIKSKEAYISVLQTAIKRSK